MAGGRRSSANPRRGIMELNNNTDGMDRHTNIRSKLGRIAAGAGGLALMMATAASAENLVNENPAAQPDAMFFSADSHFHPDSGAFHDYPTIPLKEGVLCLTSGENSELNGGTALPVWQGEYTNLAAVGAGSADSDWIENLLFILSIAVLGTGLTVLARRPENQRLRPNSVNWNIQISDQA